MDRDSPRRRFLARASVVVGVSTIALTAGFVGVLAFLTGEVVAFGAHVPWYLSVAAVAFVATILALEAQGIPGGSVISTAAIVAFTSFVVVSLGVEGLLFAARSPGAVFVPGVGLSLFAAALIVAGVGYWAFEHWREFAGRAR
ncbi:hypothetical protein BRC90_08825 [Halobacteriales archaeon QS_4_69_34]|nr:MAG: hypothetical protein BRC90_08825 [Halobacteriales archaeon QS_4_69_34]